MTITRDNADRGETCVWLFEDIEATIGRFLEEIGDRLDCPLHCATTLEEARQAIERIKDGDVVSVDSTIDHDSKAGLRIVAEIRRRGKLCHLLWHGGLLPPVGMEESLALEIMPGIDASARRATQLLGATNLPALDRNDARSRGREWLASIDLSPLMSYLPLYVCCLGYLCVAGALNRNSRGAESGNPVTHLLHQLPEKVRERLSQQAERFEEQAGRLVRTEASRGWFDEALFMLEGDWQELRRGKLGSDLMAGVGRAGWRNRLEHALQMELASENGFQGNGEPDRRATEKEWGQLAEKRFKQAVADTSGLCCHLLRLREEEDQTEEGLSEEWFQRICKAYLGLRFLARVFLNFSTHPLMKRRGHLNHAVSNNELGFLFQLDRRAETQKVLNGTVGENSGGDTKKRLRKWPGIFSEILENVEQIAREFDPLSQAIEPLTSHFPSRLLEWLGELAQETSRLWLGLNEWKAAVRSSMETFDLALPNQYRARAGAEEAPSVDIDKLAELFQEFRGEYSGKRFFNIAERA